MNIEIKFRGLTVNGFWVYGNLIQGKNGTCYICSINENPVYKNGDYWYIDSPCYVVIPKTVGQFTGLKDKNGVEIYEGDVCKHNEDIAEIKYWEGAFIFNKYAIHNYSLTNFACCRTFEVIGNIYENPDLLTI